MKTYYLFFSLCLSITGIYGQEEQHQVDSAELQKAGERVAEISVYYEQEDVEDYTDLINPAIGTFFNMIREHQLEDLYAMTADKVKERRSKEDFLMYYDLCNKYFGRPEKYENPSHRIMNNPMGKGKIVSATFDIEFEKYPGKGSTIFNIINRDTIRLQMFTLSLKKYTSVGVLDEISKPTMNAILNKDNKAIYELASQNFKESNSFSDLDSLTKGIFDLDLSDPKIFMYIISANEGQEVIGTAFLVNKSSGILQMTHTKIDNSFYLNGLKYIPRR